MKKKVNPKTASASKRSEKQKVRKAKPLTLAVRQIPESAPRITESWCKSNGEALSVCLEHFGHQTPAILSGRTRHGSSAKSLIWHLEFELPTDPMRNTFADWQYAVEHAAYALALLLSPVVTKKEVVLRSPKGGGFDFVLGPKDVDVKWNADNYCRLEVSGILEGDTSLVNQRIREKEKQTLASAMSGTKAYVSISEFGKPQSHYLQVQD